MKKGISEEGMQRLARVAQETSAHKIVDHINNATSSLNIAAKNLAENEFSKRICE